MFDCRYQTRSTRQLERNGYFRMLPLREWRFPIYRTFVYARLHNHISKGRVSN